MENQSFVQDVQHAETKSHRWHAAPMLSLSRWLTCYALKSICKVLTFHDSHFYSALPTSTVDWPLKYLTLLAAIVPKITASHRCITSHRRLYSTCCTHTPWSLNSPLHNTASHFHTNTAAAIEAIPAGGLLRHETGFGGCAVFEAKLQHLE